MIVPAVVDRTRLPHRLVALALLFFAFCGHGTAQEPPAKGRPAQAAEEGKQISDYDFAVSHAMRALMAAGPEQGRVTVYVARKEGVRWHVYFGSFDVRGPLFKVGYDVVQKKEGSPDFEVRKFRREVPADPELNRAATALVTALGAFQPRTVRFRTYVWRHSDGRWVTYFVPTPVQSPLRGRPAQPVINQRVVVSPDARQVVETQNYPDPDSAVRVAPPASPTFRDVLGFFLDPELAPFRLISQSLVCEINWRGEFESCLIAP